jgi:hypothetical protein
MHQKSHGITLAKSRNYNQSPLSEIPTKTPLTKGFRMMRLMQGALKMKRSGMGKWTKKYSQHYILKKGTPTLLLPAL